MRRSMWRSLKALPFALTLVIGFAALAFADQVTGQTIHVHGTEATNTYTNDLTVDVEVHAVHCPSGGDMNAIELSFSNVSSTGPWTIVKADGAAWPTGNCVSGVAPANATFSWTLADTGDGARTVYAKFRHGGDNTFAQDGIVVDKTAPIITDDGPTASADGAGGWYVSAVTNQFSASDGTGSGLADPSKASFTVSSGTAEGSAVTIPSGPVSDVAGNTNTGIDSAAFKIDLSNPSVAITSPAGGTTTSATSVTVEGTASDAISGIASVTVNGVAATYDAGAGTFSASVPLSCGANSITATATDVAGRTATTSAITVNRTCSSYTIDGFYQPVGGSGMTIGAKGGSTIPLKFNVRLDGAIQPDTSLVQSLVQKSTCNGGSEVDMLTTDELSSGNTTLRFDTTSQQMIFNWKTPKGAGCYRVKLTVSGGASIWVLVNLT